MVFPDGRQDTYAYAYGTYATNSTPPVFTENSTGEYVRVTLTHGTTNSPLGVAYRTVREIAVNDPLGRPVLEETYVNTGGSNYTRVAWTVHERNDLGQVTGERKSDGTAATAEWGCCGKESETLADGTAMEYAYDALDRLTSSTRLGGTNLITSHTYDAAGRTLTTTRNGGGLSLTSSNQYDLAGRVVKTVDEAGLATTYAYTNDGRKVTVTLPGGGTRITESYKDGKTKSVTGTAATHQYYDYGVGTNGTQWTKVWTGPDGTNSAAWAKTTTDMLGRTVEERRAGYGGQVVVTTYAYNDLGQLAKVSATGKPDTLYEYDELGRRVRSGLDLNGNGSLDMAGSDRVTESATYFEYDGSAWWSVEANGVYASDGNATVTTNSIRKTRLTGLGGSGTYGVLVAGTKEIDIHGNTTAIATYIDQDIKTVTRLVNHPDSTTVEKTVTVNGLLTSRTTKTGLTFTYAYDGLGRRTGATDPRKGTATTAYDSDGRVSHVVDAAGYTNSYAYSSGTGRRVSVTNPQGKVTRYDYDVQGRLSKTWGDAAYPVSYAYDGFGRMTNMSTYRAGSGWAGSSWPSGTTGTGDATQWRYDEASGLLTNKVYADNKGVGYSYTASGSLSTRTWARGLTTTYSYTNGSDLAKIDYSDDTPDITFAYDRLGRQTTVTDAQGTRTFTYNDALQLASETNACGMVARAYNGYGRNAGFDLGAYAARYSYDAYGRFGGVAATNGGVELVDVSYSYLANSDLVSGWTSDGLTVTRSYESDRDLLTQVQNAVGATTVSQYDYASDALGRRTSVKNGGTAFKAVSNTQDLAAFNLYGYNDRSELTGASRFFGTVLTSTNDPVAGQDWQYAYDNIGNRETAARSDDTQTYAANSLNQYASRSVPGAAHVLGAAATQATVTVNNQATTRQGAYFHKALTVTNTSSPAYEQVIVVGVVSDAGTNGEDAVSASTGHVFVAKTPESFSYDDDGNLTSDGRWTNTWNAENRLVEMETTADAVSAGAPRVKLEFAYDYMGRRFERKVCSGYSGGTYSTTNTTTYVYDGWNVVREMAEGSTNTYAWGLDLSGSLQGAGGIGGLLAADGIAADTVLYCYDANGNIGQLVNEDDGTIMARYEYDPYGNATVASGEAAAGNPFRFSTKHRDDQSGLYYYGLRYYSPEMGRWVSRDPLAELGFGLQSLSASANLSVYRTATSHQCKTSGSRVPSQKMGAWVYLFARNDSVNRCDPLGLLEWWQEECKGFADDTLAILFDLIREDGSGCSASIDSWNVDVYERDNPFGYNYCYNCIVKWRVHSCPCPGDNETGDDKSLACCQHPLEVDPLSPGSDYSKHECSKFKQPE